MVLVNSESTQGFNHRWRYNQRANEYIDNIDRSSKKQNSYSFGSKNWHDIYVTGNIGNARAALILDKKTKDTNISENPS